MGNLRAPVLAEEIQPNLAKALSEFGFGEAESGTRDSHHG
jgi:hypothetical protein